MGIESLTKVRLRVMNETGKEEDLAELADVTSNCNRRSMWW